MSTRAGNAGTFVGWEFAHCTEGGNGTCSNVKKSWETWVFHPQHRTTPLVTVGGSRNVVPPQQASVQSALPRVVWCVSANARKRHQVGNAKHGPLFRHHAHHRSVGKRGCTPTSRRTGVARNGARNVLQREGLNPASRAPGANNVVMFTRW